MRLVEYLDSLTSCKLAYFGAPSLPRHCASGQYRLIPNSGEPPIACSGMPHVTGVFKGTNLRMKLRSPTIMFLLRTVLALPFRHTIQHHPSDIPVSPEGSPEFWLKLMISMGLVLAGGVFAGCIFWIRTYLTIFIYSDFLM